MKIGELSDQTGLTVETIRYYEKKSLLPEPNRTASNYRDYSKIHLERLLFIKNCRSLDMSHEEIKALLLFQDRKEDDCTCVNIIIEEHLEHVTQRMEQLKSLQKQLINLKKQCKGGLSQDDCGIIKELSNKKRYKKSRHNHISLDNKIHKK
ncbi:Cd(II)/Pb(II)-responsive transcriptional regulator [Thiospirochaeta perfilievii]|uniref:Cd(II)/Pb(II)-responsive transcriptional regulator n=1 Tax=Thiospirochaeta perfilievii TaxID=252967 RepID=A0A5C1Q8G1_9SPIO|nr:Cd(II)/Pb(II)-responsive transcriptional regulator [Thiospirochaeta perfilievii]QEN03648.1 Cd(II)/Pb(II)-responsive transcriptional regulator [Thiospirochaeta perfilievii]